MFALLRMGWVADLIPDPVMKGFVEGLVWVTILGQVPKLLGISIDDAGGFFSDFAEVIESLSNIQVDTAVLGGVTLIFLLALKRLAPRLPGPLIALIAVIGVVGFLGLDASGVAVVGEIEGGVSGIGFPTTLTSGAWFGLIPGASAIVVLGFTESLGASKRAAEQTGERIDPDQELIAVGLSNLGAGLSGGFVVTGALSKTAVAIDAEGKTQVGNLFAAALGVLTIAILLPLFSRLAFTALAAIVIVAMSGLSDVRYFKTLWTIRRLEFWLAVAAFVGVLIGGVLAGVVIGVLLSLIVVVDHIGRPPTSMHALSKHGELKQMDTHDTLEGVRMLVWRPVAPLIYLNARHLSGRLLDEVAGAPDLQILLLDCSAMADVDSTATSLFAEVQCDLAKSGADLWIADLRQDAWVKVAASLKATSRPIPSRYDSVGDAVEAFRSEA